MKLIFYTACAAAAGFFAVSCSSSDDAVSEVPADPGTITAKVIFSAQPSRNSRVAIGGQVDETNKLVNGKFSWSENDKIRLYAPYAAVNDVKRKINNLNIDKSSISGTNASFTSDGVNIAIGKDTYLILAQNYNGNIDSSTDKNVPGVSVDPDHPYILNFTCENSVKAILGSDSTAIDFFTGSIFTEFLKIPGEQVKWDSSTNSVSLSGTFKVLTPVLCFQLPEGTTASQLTFKNLEWSGATYNMSTGEWSSNNKFIDKTINITTATTGTVRNRIVYIPVLPESINDEASISCDGYTCSLKGLKSQLSEDNNIIFLGVLGKSSKWVKDTSK